MLFTESFITDAGKTLFARAAAQEGKIIWTNAATSSLNSDSYTTAQMNAITSQTFGTKTSSGVVTNAFSYDGQNKAAIYSELTNEEYSGEARTFGAWAKIQGDQDDVLVIVARCGSGVTPTIINPASEGVVKAFVDFALKVSAEQAQSVRVSEGWYATQAALQNESEAREALAARVVTTHKSGDTTQGDAQTIFGQKTFNSTIIGDTGSSSVIKQTGTYQGMEFTTSYGGYMTINLDQSDYRKSFHSSGIDYTAEDYYHNSVTPSKDYGNISFNVGTISTTGITRVFGFSSSYSYENTVKTLSSVNTHMDRRFVNNTEIETGRVVIEGKEFGGEKNANVQIGIDVSAGNAYSVVSSISERAVVNVTDSFKLYCESNGEKSDISVTPGFFDVKIVKPSGTQSVFCFRSIYTDPEDSSNNIHALYPMKLGSADQSIYLGTQTSPWDKVFASEFIGNVTGNVTGNLNGKIPLTAYSQLPPIGSIFLAHITVSSSTSPLGIGQTAPGSIRKAQLSIDSNGVVSASYESAIALSSGTYTLLSAIDGLSANGSTIALVMRTS